MCIWCAKKRNADQEDRSSRIKWELGYITNIIIDVLEGPTTDKKQHAPQIIRAVSPCTPNKRVGGHVISLPDSLQARGYALTRLSFDRGYCQLKVEFHADQERDTHRLETELHKKKTPDSSGVFS